MVRPSTNSEQKMHISYTLLNRIDVLLLPHLNNTSHAVSHIPINDEACPKSHFYTQRPNFGYRPSLRIRWEMIVIRRKSAAAGKAQTATTNATERRQGLMMASTSCPSADSASLSARLHHHPLHPPSSPYFSFSCC